MVRIDYIARHGTDVDVFTLSSIAGVEDPSPFEPHELGFHIVAFYKGEAVAGHWVDGVLYPVKRGAVMSVAPGQVHAFPQCGVEATIVAFTTQALGAAQLLSGSLASTGVFSPWLQSPLGELSDGAEALALNLLTGIELEIRRESALRACPTAGSLSDVSNGQAGPRRQDVLLHLFVAWVLLSGRYRVVQRKREIPGFEHLIRFLNLVDERCAQTRNAQDYERWVGLSTRQLRRVCQDHLGRTPKAIINGIVLLKIQRLLLAPETSIKAIALDFGFGDHSSLSRFFRRYTGSSPAAWRSSLEVWS